jgi:hypothetical protein
MVGARLFDESLEEKVHHFFHRASARAITAALLSLTVLSRDGRAQTCGAGLDPPWTISLPDDVRVLITRLVDASPTFRSQWYALISAPRLRVSVKQVVKPGTDRARSVMHRYQYGLLVAEVELPFGEDVELLAHEFEHVREQVEGVNLSKVARNPAAGVRDLGYGYETERAYDVGRRVAQEWSRYLKVTTPPSKQLNCQKPWRIADLGVR